MDLTHFRLAAGCTLGLILAGCVPAVTPTADDLPTVSPASITRSLVVTPGTPTPTPTATATVFISTPSGLTPVSTPDYSVSAGFDASFSPTEIPGPVFFNHTAPRTYEIPGARLEAAGCADGGTPSDVCTPESPLRGLGCDGLRPPQPLLEFLSAKSPIVAVCVTGTPLEMGKASDHIFRGGCMLRGDVGYIVKVGDRYRKAMRFDEFRNLYAPITTENEALAYALAVTGLEARYGLKQEDNLSYFTSVIEDTHVRPTADGFIVHLYGYTLCGCQYHPTSSVDILVEENGAIHWYNAIVSFMDPEFDTCVD